MAATQRIYMESTEFKPKDEYVLVNPIELDKGEQVTESGIIMAFKQNDSALDRPASGEVIEIGDAVDNTKVGEIIIWPDTDGIDLEFNDGVFLLLRMKSIIGSKK